MDLITYVADREAMIFECSSIAGTDSALAELFTLEDGKLSFNVAKIPTHRISDNSSLCLCRGISREIMRGVASMQILGECINGSYVFDTPETQAIYEANYDTSTKMIDDGEGGTVEYTPPYILGIFA